MARVILVSNRLPVTLSRNTDGTQRVEPSSGGLVAGLHPLHDQSGGIWIGHPGTIPEPDAARELGERRLIPVPVQESEFDAYYGGYSNTALWPLFHYLLDRCDFDPEHFNAYRRVNEQFAEVVLEHARPDDLIWIHDYQLMLLPQLIRRALPEARIGFFLHIPFPSSEVFRVLPQREEILRGILGADLIGVHTFEYADHLARSIRRVLGFESRFGQVRVGTREIRVEAHPLGIDVEGFRQHAFSPEAERHLAAYRDSFRGRRVILGVDRLDYTKGLPLKLEAFGRLLESSPERRQDLVFIQLAVPSREDIGGYQEQRAAVEQLVGQLNGLYGRPGHVPVHYLYRSVSPAELGALYRLADVAYVAPIRDGLNLVAKEYVASHDDGSGVLILSEFAGAASELGEALRVNPWDVKGTANRLEQALAMSPAEGVNRMQRMYRRVHSSDVHRWVGRFVRSLEAPGVETGTAPPMLSAATLAESLAESFTAARAPLLMLDYGGTLREHAARFDQAEPTDEVLALLRLLTRLPDIAVFLQSGRDRATLDEWFRSVVVSLIAEHGTWLRQGGTDRWQRIGPLSEESWKQDARPVLEEYARRSPGARIEDRSAALVWHHGDPDEDEWLVLEMISNLETVLKDAPVEVRRGARMIEVRPRLVSKARAYEHVLSRFGPFDFILIAGDDRTDEDLFAAAGGDVFSVHVGPGESIASAAVSSPRSLRELLQHLVEAREAPHAAERS